MIDEDKPGTRYWQLLAPAFSKVSICEEPDTFVNKFRLLKPALGHLFAAHWCQWEVRNGGFRQFFSTPAGVLAPEALSAFREMGLNTWASLLEEGMRFFGGTYPRDQQRRVDKLAEVPTRTVQRDRFYELDGVFDAWLDDDPSKWSRAADEYAARVER